ncbi:MAG: tRNA uridine-5-carboxymethylaminomethyl(34) synthesis GTPase MnmE [Bacteroidales bacterium]|nr:tRNA uridine-5-carboxymethylaminomethyl(34) synthesis GTPase MnmE [Bacteroidales bacterium]
MDLHFTDACIYAPATIPGTGAISIIRISGADCFSIADRVVRLRKGTIASSAGYSLHFGQIFEVNEQRASCGEPRALCEDGKLIDEVIVSVFRAPASYTGENMVEISCHASSYIVSRICARLGEEGAIPAQAGEFTRRAFMNGKMDLAQAEAVADVIASQSEEAHRLAFKQMKGGYSAELMQMRDELLRLVSLMELELDFSEEEVEFADRGELERLLNAAIEHTQALSDSFQLGNALKNGIPTVIVGAPNSGKSTLLNALCGQERAIVSDIEGTTRDTIEESCVIDGVQFRFIDTAGIRQTEETIEKLGIERTFREIQQASVVLALFDASESIDRIEAQAASIFENLDGQKQTPLLILNKCDLPQATPQQLDRLSATLQRWSSAENILCLSLKPDGAPVSASASVQRIASASPSAQRIASASASASVQKIASDSPVADGSDSDIAIHGVSELKMRLGSQMRSLADKHQTLVTNMRHAQALSDTATCLLRVRSGLASNIPTDLLAQDIREAIYHLGSITGEISTDEVLGNIFRNYCIGK